MPAQAAVIAIADAVVADLNSSKFSQPFCARRAFRPQTEAHQLQDVHLFVVPRDDVGTRESRARWQHDYRLGVFVQQALRDEEEQQGADLIFLAQQIADFYAQGHNPAGDLAVLMECNYAAFFDEKHLTNHKVLSTFITMTFRGWRP